jgi:hypothetical protein
MCISLYVAKNHSFAKKSQFSIPGGFFKGEMRLFLALGPHLPELGAKLRLNFSNSIWHIK